MTRAGPTAQLYTPGAPYLLRNAVASGRQVVENIWRISIFFIYEELNMSTYVCLYECMPSLLEPFEAQGGLEFQELAVV